MATFLPIATPSAIDGLSWPAGSTETVVPGRGGKSRPPATAAEGATTTAVATTTAAILRRGDMGGLMRTSPAGAAPGRRTAPCCHAETSDIQSPAKKTLPAPCWSFRKPADAVFG